ncbi:MAG: trehalose-phosphatase [Thermoleophilia bacterium]
MNDTRRISELPNALTDWPRVREVLAGRRPAVFLDYDGVLTPLVPRPEDAVISDRMREVVRALAARTPVCVVTGRDRRTAQRLMGMRDLVVAGSHGFEMWSPDGSLRSPMESGEFDELLGAVTRRLEEGVGTLPGVIIESKPSSVSVHYRVAGEDATAAVQEEVARILAEHPELKLTPGKRVRELLPNVPWDKGAAVRHLLTVLGLDTPDVVPVYVGDDITDEHALEAVRDLGGLGVHVGDPVEGEDRPTHATYGLHSPDEVGLLLEKLTAV